MLGTVFMGLKIVEQVIDMRTRSTVRRKRRTIDFLFHAIKSQCIILANQDEYSLLMRKSWKEIVDEFKALKDGKQSPNSWMTPSIANCLTRSLQSTFPDEDLYTPHDVYTLIKELQILDSDLKELDQN